MGGNRDNGWIAFKITRKLKGMKEALKKCHVEEFGNLQYKLQKVEEELHSLDLKAENNSITDEEKGSRRELNNEMWRLGRIVEGCGTKNQELIVISKGTLILNASIPWLLTDNEGIDLIPSMFWVSLLWTLLGLSKVPSLTSRSSIRKLGKTDPLSWKELGIYGLSVELAQQLMTDFDIQEVWQALKTSDGNRHQGLMDSICSA